MVCPLCLGEGKRPHCPNCFQKIKYLEGTDGELVYLPEFLRGKKTSKKSKSKKVIRKTAKQKAAEELETEAEKQKEAFLVATYKKLKLFNMPSTGSKEVDDMVIERFGEWC